MTYLTNFWNNSFYMVVLVDLIWTSLNSQHYTSKAFVVSNWWILFITQMPKAVRSVQQNSNMAKSLKEKSEEPAVT